MNQMGVKPYRQGYNYYLVEYSSIIDVVDEYTQRIKFD